MRAVLSSLAMVLAMVKAPGDVVGDDPSVRSPAPDDPRQALAAGAAARARSAREEAGDFPVDGAHSYGDGFGDRPGHDGQDLLASCGTPLRAATTATARLVDEDGAAGRYLVLRTAGGRDLVYMHLSDVDVDGGRARARGRAPRRRRPDRQRDDLPPALRGLGRARLVRRRGSPRPVVDAPFAGAFERRGGPMSARYPAAGVTSERKTRSPRATPGSP